MHTHAHTTILLYGNFMLKWQNVNRYLNNYSVCINADQLSTIVEAITTKQYDRSTPLCVPSFPVFCNNTNDKALTAQHKQTCKLR